MKNTMIPKLLPSLPAERGGVQCHAGKGIQINHSFEAASDLQIYVGLSALTVVEVDDLLLQCQGLFAVWEEKFITSPLCLSEILLWLL